MVRHSCYDTIFEPVQIGPVRIKIRFFQVSPCSGVSSTAPPRHSPDIAGPVI